MSLSKETTLYTVPEVAILLRLSILTIYKYIREGQLEAIAFGGHYRIERSALLRFIQEHRTSGKEKNLYEK